MKSICWRTRLSNSILDAAAQGIYTVQRGPMAAVYRARFILVGSMNPEEGRLRPQILDRFGLRVLVRGLTDEPDRLEAYRRAVAFQTSPRSMAMAYADATQSAANEVAEARALLPEVSLVCGRREAWIAVDPRDGYRVLAGGDHPFRVQPKPTPSPMAAGRPRRADIRAVATLALRMRRSAYMAGFPKEQEKEDRLLAGMLRPGSPLRPEEQSGEAETWTKPEDSNGPALGRPV